MEVCAEETRADKIRAEEINPPSVAARIPAPDHGKGSLDVGPYRWHCPPAGGMI